jgi:hypothetical protein
MLPYSTNAGVCGWRRNYAGAYAMELNNYPVFNTTDFVAACASIRASLALQHKITIYLTVALELT